MVKCFNPYSPGFSIYLKNMNIYEKLSDGFNPYSPGFSIYLILLCFKMYYINCFNPYSPGFSIYLEIFDTLNKKYELLQSLFTWIFYLFNSIFRRNGVRSRCFNPYSPGFSIYLRNNMQSSKISTIASILIHLDFLSI